MSKEHLKKHAFKPGQSGNPGGRPKKVGEALVIKQMQYADFINLLQTCSTMTREEIAVWLQRKEATMFELMFGTLIAKAAKGDQNALTMLTERLFGKVKDVTENLNVNVNTDPPTYVVEMTDGGKFVQQRPKLLKASGGDDGAT